MGLNIQGLAGGGNNPAADNLIRDVVVVKAAIDGKITERLLDVPDGVMVRGVTAAIVEG